MAKLQNELTSIQVQLISLGGIIGSSYFLGIGDSIFHLGSATLLATLLGGFIVWSVAMSMGELSVAMPRDGGFISQIKELMGKPWAAGVGWAYWVNWCTYIPSEMVAGGIIMHQFLPMLSTITWAVLFGILISLINLSQVKNFARVESTLSLIKISAIVIFCLFAFCIWLGLVNNNPANQPHFLGLSYLRHQDKLSYLAPFTLMIILQRMIMILINYQGTEIIALTAAEAKNPNLAISTAIRSLSYRIICLYFLPILLILMIMPYQEASLNESVFAHALSRYGYHWSAMFFCVIIFFAAISCANSGIYGATRALFSLSKEGLAPRFLSQLNKNNVPSWATYLTIATSWSFIPFFIFYEGTLLYKWLLAISGFAGAVCWTSISWSQLRFRKKWLAQGNTVKQLLFRAPSFPYLTELTIALQLACLAFVVFDDSLRDCLYIGVPTVFIPFIIVYLKDKLATRNNIPTDYEEDLVTNEK